MYLDRLLLLKVYNISAKKVQRHYVSWHWRVIENLRKNWFVVQKRQDFGEFWPEHWNVSETCTLIGSFCAKYITFGLKTYSGVIFYNTKEWFKVWRKTDLCFGKWHQEFGKFSTKHLKVSKLELRWGPFVKSRKCMN